MYRFLKHSITLLFWPFQKHGVVKANKNCAELKLEKLWILEFMYYKGMENFGQFTTLVQRSESSTQLQINTSVPTITCNGACYMFLSLKYVCTSYLYHPIIKLVDGHQNNDEIYVSWNQPENANGWIIPIGYFIDFVIGRNPSWVNCDLEIFPNHT